MDTKLAIGAFVTVFVAELGDKTQLATLALATEPGSRWSVFVGASLALVATTALGVLGAEVISRWVSPVVIKRLAAALFVGLGCAMAWSTRSS